MSFTNCQTFKSAVSTISLALAAAVACSSANAAYMQVRVPSHSSKYYEYRASPGETFSIEISGDGNTDLDLYVRSPSGNRVCTALGDSDDEWCEVYAPSGGTYQIEIKNRGRVYNVTQLWLR